MDKEPILSAIDYEIDRINVQKKSRGWNVWLIYVGCVTLLNFGFEIFKNPQIDSQRVLFLFLDLFFIYKILSIIYGVLEGLGNRSKKEGVYFRFVDKDLPNTFFEILLFLFFFTSLFCGKFNIYMPRELIISLQIISFMVIVANIILFLVYISKLPIPISHEIVSTSAIVPNTFKKYQVIILSFQVLFFSFVFTELIISILRYFNRNEVEEFKLALIALVLMFLLSVLLDNKEDEALLNSLSKIRRDLLLEVMKPDMALNQVGIVLTGLKSSDIFHEEISKVVELFDSMNESLNKISGIYQDYKNNSQREALPELEKYRTAVKECVASVEKSSQEMKAIGLKLTNKINIYKIFSGDFQDAELALKMQAAQAKVQERLATLQKEIDDPKFRNITSGAL